MKIVELKDVSKVSFNLLIYYIERHINEYNVSSDPYEVAKEIGSKYNWSESTIEKAEKILRNNYIK
jgi:hypothetical protein